MRKKKSLKKNRIPQIVGLTIVFVLLFIGFSMLGPQPEIPKPISQAANDFKKNPKIENIIDLTGQQAKAVTDKVGDAAKSAGKALDGAALPDKAGKKHWMALRCRIRPESWRILPPKEPTNWENR